jgi:hypothetical protein
MYHFEIWLKWNVASFKDPLDNDEYSANYENQSSNQRVQAIRNEPQSSVGSRYYQFLYLHILGE